MSPTRGKKKPARRKPARGARKRATRKPKTARGTKQPARRKPKRVRQARKPATRKPKSVWRKSARPPAARRKRSAPARRPKRKPGPASRKTARRKPAPSSGRPRLAVVKALRPKRAVAAPRIAAQPSTSFPQRETASVKQLVLFEMVRARASVMAAVHGLEDATAEAPTEPGKWSIREHVLHLCHWDYEVMRFLDSALRGQAPPWDGLGPEEGERFNDEGVAGLRHLAWSDAQRLLLSGRMKLADEVEAVPEEPAEVWQPEHPFGAMLRDLAWNDRHHADLIKRWRSERSV
jgi:DinB family protein